MVLGHLLEVIAGGSLRVTWYTSEETTESIEVYSQTFVGDNVALRKNHEMTVVPYPEPPALQTYTLTLSDGKGGVVRQDVVVTLVGTDDLPSITGSTGAT